MLSDWDKVNHQQEQQKRDENCLTIDQLKIQHQDLCMQHQNLWAAYNQCREDLNVQVRERQSLDLAFDMKRTNRAKTESRCQTLQNIMQAFESNKYQADKQQLTIIAKLTNIVYASRILVDVKESDSKLRQWSLIFQPSWRLSNSRGFQVYEGFSMVADDE